MVEVRLYNPKIEHFETVDVEVVNIVVRGTNVFTAIPTSIHNVFDVVDYKVVTTKDSEGVEFDYLVVYY